MKRAVIGAVLAVVAAQPAFAQVETRTYSMDTGGAYAGGPPGEQYVVITRRPHRQVTVIEGQPRWTAMQRQVTEERRGASYFPSGPSLLAPY